MPKGNFSHSQIGRGRTLRTMTDYSLMGHQPSGGLPAAERPIRSRLVEEGRKRYIAYSAHDLIAGDHETGRPGHLT